MITCNWIWKDRLPALLLALSHICHSTFDELDQEAITFGLTQTSLNNQWKYYEMKAGHAAMITQPKELADLLLTVSRWKGFGGRR